MAGGNDKYNNLFDDLCGTMNRRLLRSKSLNLPTYPSECIYVPDMLVAIVALNNYSKLKQGKIYFYGYVNGYERLNLNGLTKKQA